MDSLQLNVAKRPVLLPDELVSVTQTDVGIYYGNSRIKEYDCGLLYMTSHRLLWIDERKAVGLQLSLATVENVSCINGFLASSPKLVVSVRQTLGSTTPMQNSVSNASLESQGEWQCEICECFNPLSVLKCSECGVKPQKPPVPIKPASKHNLHQSDAVGSWKCSICDNLNPCNILKCALCGVQNVCIHKNINSLQIACPACTFLNPPDSTRCDVCSTNLDSPSSSSPASENVHSTTVSTLSVSPSTSIIKFSFRAGSPSEALKQIRLALENKRWEAKQPQNPPSTLGNASSLTLGGISGIMRHVEETNRQMDASMDDAFSDMKRLMEKASEMVRLAESISSKLANTSTDAPEMVAFRTFLKELGISNPVTKQMVGDRYTEELARQLAEFLDRLFNQQKPSSSEISISNTMLTLTDLYCLFNRARGVALVSPDDLYRSAKDFDRLNLPFRLRKFESGLITIQSASHNDQTVATNIAKLVQDAYTSTGLSAIELAQLGKCSVMLAMEQLCMAERVGLVCRDETIEGLFFYPNLFV